jgi:cytochrome c oxidase assembly protein subunit 11
LIAEYKESAMRRMVNAAGSAAAKAAGMHERSWSGPVGSKPNADRALRYGAVAVGMVGATYASVPLYRLFCQATGLGGATRVEDVAPNGAASSRRVRIHLDSVCAEGLPWRFTPAQRSMDVRPGESALAFYEVENKSDSVLTGVASYNVSPAKSGRHFAKVQCFCFERQQLRPREKVHLPVLFFLDPEFDSDKRCRDTHDIHLSYTFYESSDPRAPEVPGEAE